MFAIRFEKERVLQIVKIDRHLSFIN